MLNQQDILKGEEFSETTNPTETNFFFTCKSMIERAPTKWKARKGNYHPAIT